MKNAKQIYQEGYQKFKGGVFRISGTNKSTNIVIHPRYLPELKDLPEGILDYYTAIGESIFTRYTQFRADRPIVPHAIKSDLTPAIRRLAPLIEDEVQQAVNEELPKTPEFTEVNISSKLYRIIAKVSGHVFVGPELCRTERYVEIAVNYTVVRTGAQRAIAALSPWQRGVSESPGGGGTKHLVSVTPLNMNFGYGRQACPGRFFAASELKMILSRALLEYDIRLPEGTTEQFPNMDFAGLLSNDFLAVLSGC